MVVVFLRRLRPERHRAPPQWAPFLLRPGGLLASAIDAQFFEPCEALPEIPVLFVRLNHVEREFFDLRQ